MTIARAGVFSVLVGRLAYLQIAENSNYKKLSDNNRITHRFLEPERVLFLICRATNGYQ